MDIRRVVLYAILVFVVYSLWTAWQHDYPPPLSTTEKVLVKEGDNLLPTMKESTSNPVSPQATSTTETANKPVINVKTDVLDLSIDTTQGDIIKTNLLAYPQTVGDSKPITLLNDLPAKRYVANSSLFTQTGDAVKNINFNLTSAQTSYELAADKNELTVTLQGQNEQGLEVRKIYTFTRGSYLIKMAYYLENKSSAAWQGYMNTQLLRSSPEEEKTSLFEVGSYTGASYSNPGKHRYQKVSFKDMTKANLSADVKGGWLAMQQHYFLSAWIPTPDSQNVIYTRASNNDYAIGAVSQPLVVEPGKTKEVGASLYVGPEDTGVLSTIAPGLDMTVDYGFLWVISSPLFSLMKIIYNFIGNWGWTIVLVTVLIKLAFYRLSARSYKSMAGMRKLQPKLQALRERYGDDKAKMSQATMELYKQEKVNPLGGCLPILVQIPVFIALYWVLLGSVELRQAPFIFWIKDLAEADPYHILPIIMGGTMLIQQRLNPAPPDPMQAKMMMFLPILFTVLFWNFPSGLVLYWIVNNTLSILQQWYITRKYGEEKATSKKIVPAK